MRFAILTSHQSRLLMIIEEVIFVVRCDGAWGGGGGHMRIGHPPWFYVGIKRQHPQIGPTSQRADQSALAARGPVGREGPQETGGSGPLLSGAATDKWALDESTGSPADI